MSCQAYIDVSFNDFERFSGQTQTKSKPTLQYFSSEYRAAELVRNGEAFMVGFGLRITVKRDFSGGIEMNASEFESRYYENASDTNLTMA